MSTVSDSGASLALPTDLQKEVLGVSFFDLSRFSEWGSTDDDEKIAAFLQRFYMLSAQMLEPAGARIVKYMGDAGMAVFPESRGEEVILVLCDFAEEVRRIARDEGFDTWCNVTVHVGEVLTGSFGPPGTERFDVIGKTVNIAARLGRRGIILSPQAYRTLSEAGRERFRKITRPITYSYRGTSVS